MTIGGASDPIVRLAIFHRQQPHDHIRPRPNTHLWPAPRHHDRLPDPEAMSRHGGYLGWHRIDGNRRLACRCLLRRRCRARMVYGRRGVRLSCKMARLRGIGRAAVVWRKSYCSRSRCGHGLYLSTCRKSQDTRGKKERTNEGHVCFLGISAPVHSSLKEFLLKFLTLTQIFSALDEANP